MPGGAVAPRKPPPTTLPVSAPPGYHYYEMHGIAYFSKLATGEKVNLGPVESPSSLVTLSGKKERMATAKMENAMATVKMESTTFGIETTKRKAAGNDDVVDLSENIPKKSRPVAARHEDIEVVQIDDDDDDLDDDEPPNTCDLPNTCDFTPPAAKKKDSRSDESSDGGETVLGSEEQDLFLSSDSYESDRGGRLHFQKWISWHPTHNWTLVKRSLHMRHQQKGS
jgi:hypothetical protein